MSTDTPEQPALKIRKDENGRIYIYADDLTPVLRWHAKDFVEDASEEAQEAAGVVAFVLNGIADHIDTAALMAMSEIISPRDE